MIDRKKLLEEHYRVRGLIAIQPKVDINSLEDLAFWYTPGVGEICKELVDNPNEDMQLTIRGNAIAVISDGSAVLGLGNIGATGGLPVMEGKALLFKSLGGVDAYPLVIDNQDLESLILIIKSLAKNFAGINLEDVSAPRCFELERRLNEELDIPVVHDDQHATAIVTLAGIINAAKVANKDLYDSKIVISGIGAAGTAVAKLLKLYGVKDFSLLDSKGTLTNKRSDIVGYKEELVNEFNLTGESKSLEEALVGVDIFIGLSVGNVVTPEMIKSMNKNPIVFAMANPVPEILPDLAIASGASVVATGRSDFPNQINNVLIFPGLFKGLLSYNVKRLTPKLMLEIAKAVADLTEEPTADKIITDVLDYRVVDTICQTIRDCC